MYVQYTELAEPVCPYPILMWHGGGLPGVTWETTPDGREGFDTLFLRHGFNVYVSDAVERGRASWAKFPEINPVPPCFNSYAERWTTYRLGPKYPESYEGHYTFAPESAPVSTMLSSSQGTMRKLHERILELGGDSTWMHLPEMGIRGNTHAMMQDDNSRQIADLVCDWLVKKVPCGSK